MSVGVVVGNVLIITLPIDAHVSHAFCAREFIKRHLIGSRATLVSPRIFPPLRPFPRAPRTKVEYSATGFGRCTMSRAMSTLLFSFPPPLYSFHALVRGIFSSSAVARIDLLSLLGDLRIFVPSFNPFFPPPATWKVEPRRVCRRLNRRRVSALISSRFAVERCRCVTDARHVNYTVNVKGIGEGVDGREGWLSLLCMEDARIYVEACVTSNDLRSYFGMRGDRKRVARREIVSGGTVPLRNTDLPRDGCELV